MSQTSNENKFYYKAVLGTLVARTAIHIGSGQDSKVTDSLCRRDIEGNYIIPGTAIGGALRNIATRIAPRLGSKPCRALWKKDELDKKNSSCLCWVCNLFGDINPGVGDGKTPDGEASHIFIAHSLIEKNTLSAIRDGVGIDRISKTSANASSAKFDLEVLPKGIKTELRIELAHNATQQDEILLAATLAEWQEGRCWLGGRVARGLGAFELEKVRLVKRDMSESKAIVSFLKVDDVWSNNNEFVTEDKEWLKEQLKEKAFCEADICSKDFPDTKKFIAQSFMKIEFELKMKSAFLVNDTVASAWRGVDSFPLLSNSSAFFDLSQGAKPLLPGSSLRGVIRSQAEKIARTLTTLKASKKASSKEALEHFLQHCPACNPLERRTDEPLANCGDLLKGKVSSDKELGDSELCLACRLFGSSRLGSRLIVEDSEANENLVKKMYDFVAIDRFTGGARDKAKFDAVTAIKPSFKVRIHLENPKKWELGWLVLTLRDLKDGLVPIGFGAAKGFGQVRVDNYTFTYGFISDFDFLGDVKQFSEMQKGDSGVYKTLAFNYGNPKDENFSKLTTLWVEAFNEKCEKFNRDEKITLIKDKDSYFDEKGKIAELYGMEAYKCLLP